MTTNDPVVLEAADDYTGLPLGDRFTPDTNLVRVAECDAFKAGVAWILSHPAEYARLAAEWTRHVQ